MDAALLPDMLGYKDLETRSRAAPRGGICRVIRAAF